MSTTYSTPSVAPGDWLTVETNATLRLADGVVFDAQADAFRVKRCGLAQVTGYAGSHDAQPVLWVNSPAVLRYEAHVGDAVIGVIIEKTMEQYTLDLGAGQLATLSTIAFDGASRRNCPALELGNAVYCQVESVNKFLPARLTCMSPAGQKHDWVTGQCIFGELKAGMMIRVSLRLAHELMQSSSMQQFENDDGEGEAAAAADEANTATADESAMTTELDKKDAKKAAAAAVALPLLEILGKKLQFEITIGVNGMIWVNSVSVHHIVTIINIIRRYDETHGKIDVQQMLDTAIRAYQLSE